MSNLIQAAAGLQPLYGTSTGGANIYGNLIQGLMGSGSQQATQQPVQQQQQQPVYGAAPAGGALYGQSSGPVGRQPYGYVPDTGGPVGGIPRISPDLAALLFASMSNNPNPNFGNMRQLFGNQSQAPAQNNMSQSPLQSMYTPQPQPRQQLYSL